MAVTRYENDNLWNDSGYRQMRTRFMAALIEETMRLEDLWPRPGYSA